MQIKLEKRSVFCPVCTTEREIPSLKIPWPRVTRFSLSWALLLGLLTFLLGGWSTALWTTSGTGMLCFIGLEVYYTHKFKREFVCPICHFDPMLYRRSPEEAKRKCLDNLKEKEAFLAKWHSLKTRAEAEGK